MTELRLNGKTTTVEASPDTPLLWALRDHLGMTGTKFGRGKALCHACTVHLDGAATFSCVLPLSAVAGREVTTIEGLTGRVARAVQAAWDRIQVPQCDYCQSGQAMGGHGAAQPERQAAKPSDADIDQALQGNLCRCSTYQRIRLVIHGYGASASFRRCVGYRCPEVAVGYYKRGNSTKAAIRLHPLEPRHYVNLGLCLLGAENFRKVKTSWL